MTRGMLVLLANALNITHANYPNDSNLEQACLYALKQLTTTTSASTVATTEAQAHHTAGDKNV